MPKLRIPAHRLLLRPLKRERAFGTCIVPARTISIDPRNHNVTHTLLHELQHLQNPSWSETRVRLETARLWKSLTWREHARLIRALGRGRIGHGEDE